MTDKPRNFVIMFFTNDGGQEAWSGTSYDLAIAQLDEYREQGRGKPFPTEYVLYEVLADTYDRYDVDE